MKTKHAGTLGSVVQFYFGRTPPKEVLNWPPDVFAIAAKILKMTGCYGGVVNKWPPKAPRKGFGGKGGHPWHAAIQQIGREWRDAVEHGRKIPVEVRDWWTRLIGASAIPLDQLSESHPLARVLLQLVAAADEACAEIGIPTDATGTPRPRADLAWRARVLMQIQNLRDEPCTLCREIPSSLLAVLPKLHTPTTGATLRSLTHHLALHDNPEISVRWTEVITRLDHTLNVLCVPWPLEIRPIDFRPTTSTTLALSNMRGSARFFDFEPPKRPAFVKDFQTLLQRALSYVGGIDAVVFPELALDGQTFQQIRRVLDKTAPACCLIAGVRSQGRNQAFCSIPGSSHVRSKKLSEVREQQDKHHRWKLERSQIGQYGLGGRLDAGCSWWESTRIQPRTMNFFSLQPWLTMGVLICEDLARQDPAGDLMRSVGPNLVISLLMDGPQLASRWSARYATVLADDPGSSVLTLSSLGMVLLSKPFDKPASRVVGLWKDYKSPQAVQIELPPGKMGVVLSLTRRIEEEFSADGRSDEGATAYLTLTGMHSI